MKTISIQLSKSIQPLSENTNNLAKLTFKDLLPGFIWIFIPTVLIISLITYGLIYQYQIHQQELRKLSTLNSINHVNTDIELTFRNITSDLHYLAESRGVRSFADGDKNSLAMLASDLLQFSLKKGLYDQVRFIDITGMEKVRINYYAGQATIVPKDALQNKKGRYYFKDSLDLSRDNIFVSPLDLNIEHGQVERPFKPMIRFGILVFGSDGQKKGIILLNFLAEKLLNLFNHILVDTNVVLSVLNRNGYWLFSSYPGDEWGFMFSDHQELTFGKRFPKAWHEIRENISGLFSNESEKFIYHTIYPIPRELYSSTGSGKAYESSTGMLKAQDYFWKVVAHYPNITLFDVTRTSGFWILYCLTIIAMGTGTWFRSHYLLQTSLMVEQLQRSRSDLKKQIDERTSELLESHQQLELLLESTGEALYGINTQGRCTFANHACVKILGYQNESQLLGKNMHKLTHNSYADGSPYDEVLCPTFKAFRKGEAQYLDDDVLWRADNSAFAAEIRSYPILLDGMVLGSVVTFNDITERKRTEIEKAQLHQDMENRMKELQCLFEITEAIRKDNKVEDMLYDIINLIPLGWNYPEYTKVRIILGDKEFINDSFDLTEWKLASEIILDNKSRGSIEVYYTKEFPEFYEGPFLKQELNLLNSITKILTQAIEHKYAEMELQHLATHDPLTGLYNRKILEQRVGDEVLRATRYKHSLSMFMLDIDYFKQVNDTYGHQAGDTVLCNLAKILQDSIRKTDYAARYGGEEFIIILPETDILKAEELADRLCKIISKHTIVMFDDKELRITASIGITTFPEHAQTWEDLLKAADTAMYAAKENGRNQVQIFSSKLH